MKKKLTVSILLIVVAALVLFGLNAFAFGSSTSASSTVLNGTLTKLDAQKSTVSLQTAEGEKTVPLAASVWVYRDDQKALLPDLKTGDRLEVVMNSKNQAAYIKAFTAISADTGPQAPAATPTPTASPAATATPAPTMTTVPAVSAPPVPAKTPSPIIGQNSIPGTDGLRLQVNGPHFSLEMKQSEGNGNKKYELNVKPEDGSVVRLNGDEAAKWIRALLGSVNLQSADAEQQLLLLISKQYGIDKSKLQVKMDLKTNQQQTQQQLQQQQTGQHEDNNGGHGNHSNAPAAAAPAGKPVKQEDKNAKKQQGNQQYGNHNDNQGENGKGNEERDN